MISIASAETVVSDFKAQGWRVKKSVTKLHKGNIVKYLCNKKHVNVRVYTKHIGHGSADIEVYARNANGGYNIVSRYNNNIDSILNKIDELLKQEEPAIPTWNKEDLPVPNKFGNSNVLRYSKHINAIYFDEPVIAITGLALCTINNDCTINFSDISNPSDRIWIFMHVNGHTTGSSTIICNDDCEYYYVTGKRKGNKDFYKISIENNNTLIDFDNLTARDKQKFRIAIKECLKQYVER